MTSEKLYSNCIIHSTRYSSKAFQPTVLRCRCRVTSTVAK